MKTIITIIILSLLTACTSKNFAVSRKTTNKTLTYDTTGLTISNNAIVLIVNAAITTLANPTAENNATLTAFTGTGLPTGLSLNSTNGSISGTPTVVGIYNTEITGIAASAPLVKYIYKVQIYVNAITAPSALIYPTPNAMTINVLGTINKTSVTGSDITYSSADLPSGYTINATTGSISGTYTGHGGDFTSLIVATNTSGSTNFSIGINFACEAGYTKISGTCVQTNQSRSCLTQPSNTSGGTESTTDGGVTWVSCSGYSCSAGFTLGTNGTTCEVAIIQPLLNFSTGTDNTCAISANKAYCWGWNGVGTIGDGTNTDSSIPVAVTGVVSTKNISEVSVGDTHACAVATDGIAYCWGNNANGQLGNNTTTTSSIPVPVDLTGVLSGKTILHISASSYFTCAIASDNQIYCWGYNDHGQLGDTTVTQRLVPTAVSTAGVLSGKTILQMATGINSVCVIASDYKAYCWGANDHGQLGDNTFVEKHQPVAVDMTGVLSGKTLRQISNKINSIVCVIASDNLAYCWGDNGDGGLGNGLWADSAVPTTMYATGDLSGKKIKAISSGANHVCAYTDANTVVCFGRGSTGQIGNGLMTFSEFPVNVTLSGVLAGKTITNVTTGWGNSCALTSENKMYCWGWNNASHFGLLNDYDMYDVPVQAIPGFTL